MIETLSRQGFIFASAYGGQDSIVEFELKRITSVL